MELLEYTSFTFKDLATSALEAKGRFNLAKTHDEPNTETKSVGCTRRGGFNSSAQCKRGLRLVRRNQLSIILHSCLYEHNVSRTYYIRTHRTKDDILNVVLFSSEIYCSAEKYRLGWLFTCNVVNN